MSRYRPSRQVLPALGLVALLGACAPECVCPPTPAPSVPPAPVYELRPTAFDDLRGWRIDDPSPALAAFRDSCRTLARRGDDEPFGLQESAGRVADWRPACEAAARLPDEPGGSRARAFFETWFTPHRVSDGGDPEGLFTGYYEPLLEGSRERRGPYTVPLRRPPEDLVRLDLGRFAPDLAGRSIAGRIEDGTFVPYHPRAAIEAGLLDGRDLALLWVDDPIDKFFLQIQGSGQVLLDDGRLVRVGYAAQNGHPYRAIGRDLVEIGALALDQVSMQSIRAWLEAHPRAAEAIMARNRSYVFFEERPELRPEDGPLGAQGIPLAAGRSLAVDPRWIPLGAPVWLETTVPYPEGPAPLRRLVVAQDTGGAIKGIVRGDVFFGTGERAEAIAGRMRSPGRYVLLLPRRLTS